LQAVLAGRSHQLVAYDLRLIEIRLGLLHAGHLNIMAVAASGCVASNHLYQHFFGILQSFEKAWVLNLKV
jgi:hypothetical protein